MKWTLCIFFVVLLTTLQAQTLTNPCEQGTIQQQADSMKLKLEKAGFSVLREAAITMESEYEIPIIVPMSQGEFYQFVFIGDKQSSVYEVRMFDYKENQVVYEKKGRDGKSNNVISYQYTPKSSEYHMIKPLQVNIGAKRNLCGYVLLFKKDYKYSKLAR